MTNQELFEMIANHPESNPEFEKCSESDITAFAEEEKIQIPTVYREFLLRFGPLGEFAFARMRDFPDDEAIEPFWELYESHLGANARQRYLPFGDDYSGNFFCFELQPDPAKAEVVLVDDVLIDFGDFSERYPSFHEFVHSSLAE